MSIHKRRVSKIECDYDEKGRLIDIYYFWTDTGQESFCISEYTGKTEELLEVIEDAIVDLNDYFKSDV